MFIIHRTKLNELGRSEPSTMNRFLVCLQGVVAGQHLELNMNSADAHMRSNIPPAL